MRNELVTVVTQYTENAKLQRDKQEKFAEKKSVTRSEFYSAFTSGLSAKYVFDLDSDDYESCIKRIKESDSDEVREYKPTHIIHDNVEYKIVRDFKNGASTEVTVR